MKELRHIAFIMDGNGRWAKKRHMPRKYGHREGVKAMKRIVAAAAERGIQAVSFYAFSTENWSRPKDEVEALFKMVEEFADKELREYAKKGYRVRFMGDIGALPESTASALYEIISMTEGNAGLTVNIGLNYGGRDEITRAVKTLAETHTEITSESIGLALDTAGLPDPDVIVRSAGEKRLSNFMLWQAAYSELIFRDEFWPEFDKVIFNEIVAEYLTRDRRFGAVKPE